MGSPATPTRGPKRYRWGLYFFGFLLTVLLIWLGGFVLEDIAAIPVPEIPRTDLLEKEKELNDRLAGINESIQVEEEKQAHLRQSTDASRQTLNQLLEFRRDSLNEKIPISPEESRVFADSQRIFLSNQEQVQAVMERILGLKAEKRDAEKELREVREEVGEVRRPLVERHRNKIAMLKFAFLAPFVIVGCWMFFRKRGSNYVSLVYAFDAAVLFLLMTVIHEHFPRRYYKYMFIAMAIAVVVGVLLFIIRQSTKPSRKSLLQRYREAYHAARCPVCHYPIVGENLRSIVPDRRIGRKLPPTLVVEQEGARVYSCPACGTRLFDRCAECQAIRHTLLPHCIHCGAESEAPEKA